MKKLILSFILLIFSIFVFGQSITLAPTANDSQILTGYGNVSPNIVGLRAKGTPASPTAVLAGDNLFTLQGRGYNGSSFSTDAIGIVFDANQTFTTTAKGTSMQFFTTTNNTNTVLERMRINHDGNVGIGTTTPGAKLVVNGDFALKGITTLSVSATITALDRQENSIINFTGSGTTQTLKGIAGGTEGMILYLVKDDNVTLNVFNDDNSTSAGNRIFTHTSANFTSAGGTRLGGITLIYVNNYWRVVSIAE